MACLTLLSAACSPVLDGNQEMVVGRAMIIPCLNPGNVASALVIVESRYECWPSAPQERVGCDLRKQAVVDDPEICSELIVMDSPSELNLTGFITQPFDPQNMLAAATTSVWGLPCNPDGQFASGYPSFQEQLVEFTGSVRITADEGPRAELEYDLQDANGDDAIVGTSDAEVCR